MTSAREAAGHALHLPGVETAARVGLFARTGFYLVLTGLTIAVAAGGDAAQTNGHGALALLAENPGGDLLIALAAVGFIVLALVRIAAAIRDADGSWWSRVGTGLQGLFFAGVASVPISFLAGDHSTGSEQSQHREASEVLGMPGGRELVMAVAVIVLVTAGWQVRTALTTDFTEGLNLPRNRQWLCTLTIWSGRAGIVARSVVYLPIAGFLFAAAIDSNASQADGLDAELQSLAGQTWGVAVLALVALGLLTFSVYSGLEATLRDLKSDE